MPVQRRRRRTKAEMEADRSQCCHISFFCKNCLLLSSFSDFNL